MHGADSVETSVSLNNLGVLSAHLGQLQLARELLARSYGIRARAYGDGHHLTICAKQNMDYINNKIQSICALDPNNPACK